MNKFKKQKNRSTDKSYLSTDSSIDFSRRESNDKKRNNLRKVRNKSLDKCFMSTESSTLTNKLNTSQHS
jgi:hypothetical protein